MEIDPLAAGLYRQIWRIDLAFAPGEESGRMPPWAGHELWRLHVAPIVGLELTDWRDMENLTVLGEDAGEGEVAMLPASMENLCESRVLPRDAEIRSCRFLKRDGHRFVLEMDGEIAQQGDVPPEDGVAGDFRLLMEVSFRSVKVAVPVNASDPLAAGVALAGRELGVRAHGRTHVKAFDPERAESAFDRSIAKPSVFLETGCQGAD